MGLDPRRRIGQLMDHLRLCARATAALSHAGALQFLRSQRAVGNSATANEFTRTDRKAHLHSRSLWSTSAQIRADDGISRSAARIDREPFESSVRKQQVAQTLGYISGITERTGRLTSAGITVGDGKTGSSNHCVEDVCFQGSSSVACRHIMRIVPASLSLGIMKNISVCLCIVSASWRINFCEHFQHIHARKVHQTMHVLHKKTFQCITFLCCLLVRHYLASHQKELCRLPLCLERE